MSDIPSKNDVLDIIGIGLGPFNLSLAALLHPLVENKQLSARFLECKDHFDWHPGLLLDGTTLQVPFMADLVTMADPTSPFSYLNYLHEQGRLYRFYFREDFLVPRKEYNFYCQWAAQKIDYCQFSSAVHNVKWLQEKNFFEVIYHTSGQEKKLYAKHLVLGIGSSPSLPSAIKELAKVQPNKVFHSAQLLDRLNNIDTINKKQHITVLGSGQSAAEAFQLVLEKQNDKGFSLDWFTRSSGFFPMEYSKLGLQHFTPDYIHYMRSLSQEKRDTLIPKQGLLYKGISAYTIAVIHDRLYEMTAGGNTPPVSLLANCDLIEARPAGGQIALQFHHKEQDIYFEQSTDMIIAGTGYAASDSSFLKGISDGIYWDSKKRYQIDDHYCLSTKYQSQHSQIFIQNGELHTHGISAPDLGLGAHRAATIINTLLGKEVYKTREKNSCLDFGVNPSRKIINKLQEAI